MECSDVRENLAAAIDGELRPGDLAAVDAHLSACADCRAERDAVQRLMTAASTTSTGRASALPAVRAEIDREIMLGLVDQVSALTAEVKALRAELGSTRTVDTAVATHARISAELTEDDLDVEKMSEEAPIIRIAHAIVQESLRRKASEIHIEPTQKGVRIQYRIDGVLNDAMTVPKHIQNQLIARFKIMADLNVAERQVPQVGRISIKTDGTAYELGVSCTPGEFGEQIAIRIVEKTNASDIVDVSAMTEGLLRERAEQQLYQAMRIAQDADGVVDQGLVDAVRSNIRSLTTALNGGGSAGVKAELVELNTGLLALSKAFVASRGGVSVEGAIPRKSPTTSTTATLHERKTGVSDFWSLAIS